MELHTEVPQFDYEVRAKNELAVCVRRGSHLVSPLLRLVIDCVQINVFVRLPTGATEYNWLVRSVIILVSPDLGRIKERCAHKQVCRVHAARNEDLFVA